jgi:tripartite-type tricarboxylate transporter receptor subunit TctC
MIRKTWQRLAVFALGSGLFFSVAAQDAYPSRPIKLVVPYSPGGGTDGVARKLAQELRNALGQTVVVENRPGAGATIGHDVVAKSAPDGYTLIVSANTLAVFNLMYPKLPFDPATAFTPIAIVANSPMVFVGGGKSPYANLKSVVQAAKENPGSLTFGTAGAGTPMHLAGELLSARAGITIEHVPYKGSGPAIGDVVGGHIPFGVFGLSSTLPFIRDGRLKAFGVFDARRTSLDPSLPTLAEAGVTGSEAPLIYTVLGAAGTPKPIVTKLTTVLKKILSNDAMKPAFAAQGFVPQYGTPEQVTELYNAEALRWRDVIKATKLNVE